MPRQTTLDQQISRLGSSALASLAERLVAVDVGPASELAQQLERRLSARPLERFERVWQLSSSQAAQVFGVSRQAYSKWHHDGVPADRRSDVQLVDDATQQLVDHVKVERIPAVVRRSADRLGGASLLGLAKERQLARLRDESVAMFDLRRVQP